MGDERVDGQHLTKLEEPGSDELLSEWVRERIREAMEYTDKLEGVHGLPDSHPRSR